MTYRVKSSWLIKQFYPGGMIWDIPVDDGPAVYLTFDDGPHPTITEFVLKQLEEYNAKASFFCIGNNVEKHSATYHSILSKGHVVGNHTFNHLNGWDNTTEDYLHNVTLAAKQIDSGIFRPPYGRMKRAQISMMLQATPAWKIYMWDVLSGDFDKDITPEKCLSNVLTNIEPGSIVVFHDSEKAYERMSYALPRVLEFCKNKGWEMRALPI